MSTHHQLIYHIVFSTKNRKRYLVNDGFREKVFAYMAGVTKDLGGFALRIGGYYDHVHLLIRIPAKVSISEFVGKVKSNTSKHINSTSGAIKKFGWQDGFGAFTVSPSQKERVVKYIDSQVAHHSENTFEDEYIELLKKHEVCFDEKYVFD